MSETIRWLHLTDLHAGMKEQDWLWPRMQSRFRDSTHPVYRIAYFRDLLPNQIKTHPVDGGRVQRFTADYAH